MAGTPFKMKGSPYPDKESRKAKRKHKEETVVIDGKTYNKAEIEASKLKEESKLQNLTDAQLEALRNK